MTEEHAQPAEKNTSDMAVEIELYKCRKLLERDPRLRKKARVKFSNGIATLLFFCVACICLKYFFDLYKEDYPENETFLRFVGMIIILFFAFGVNAFCFILSVSIVLNKAVVPKMLRQIAQEYEKFSRSSQNIDEQNIFDKQELRTMKKAEKTRRMIKFSACVDFVLLGILICLLVWMWGIMSLFMMKIAVDIPPASVFEIMVAAAVVGFLLSIMLLLGFRSFFGGLSELFIYKKTTLHEQLLLKLRDLNS